MVIAASEIVKIQFETCKPWTGKSMPHGVIPKIRHQPQPKAIPTETSPYEKGFLTARVWVGGPGMRNNKDRYMGLGRRA